MPLKRSRHWETHPEKGVHGDFETFLRARSRLPFAWGSNDCALFAADAIHSFTGVDIADAFRGRYHDEASAFALIRDLTGGATIADAAAFCAARHGLTELEHPLMAQRGDLVIMRNGSAEGAAALIAGVVHLNGRDLVSMGPAGPVRVSILNVKRAWHV